jgi:hypothetical protein
VIDENGYRGKFVSYHDAGRQLEYVRQSLSQNKKHIGFFIGAGCPLAVRIETAGQDGPVKSEPIIPDVAGLTAMIAERLKSPQNGEQSLYARMAALFAEDEKAEFTIEDVLSMVRSMSQVAGKGKVRGFTADELEQIDRSICEIISEVVDKNLPSKETPYHDVAIWARSLVRDKPVHIFTTNYDLLMEEALEDSGAPYFDGFVGSRNAFFDLGAVENEKLIVSRWLRLWKIHGSINWRLKKSGGSESVSVVRSDTIEAGQKYLIYPSHLKFDQSRKMPYLALMDRLKDFLLCPSSILFMSGYSFSDDHINDIIVSGLKNNSSAMVYAFLFGPLNANGYAKAVACGKQIPNLVIAAQDRAVIGRQEREWICSGSPDGGDTAAKIIELKGEETEENEGRIPCHFHLGDFAKLGALLKSLSRDELASSAGE